MSQSCVVEGIGLSDLVFVICFYISSNTYEKRWSCHTGIIESVVDDLAKIIDLDSKYVVIRSTVPVGLSDKLNCYFMPEFLTEKNYEQDFINTESWIFGLKDGNQYNEQNKYFTDMIGELFASSHDAGQIKSKSMTFMANSEAEAVKLFRNTFLATKVSFCNEFEEFCKSYGINYNNVVNIAAVDKRIGLSHTSVPGHDGKRGFGGTCFPKDIANVHSLMKAKDIDSYILKAVIERNNTHDRPEHDWNENVGRAVI